MKAEYATGGAWKIAASTSRVIDLAVDYFPGMPYIPATAPYHYGMTREHGDQMIAEGLSSAADQVVMNLHSGTHIDALCHYARNGRLFGDVEASQVQNKWKGICAHGVHEIGPIVRRGVLLDIPALLGVDRLSPGTEIGAGMLEGASAAGNVEIGEGDVVLVRTGDIQLWPSQDYYSPQRGGVPGLNLEGAQWLSARKIFMVGSDNYAIEHIPARTEGRRASAMPVHGHLLVDCGIFLLEVMNLEELSKVGRNEFLFIALPLKVRGGTGSPVRPIAVFED